MSARVGGTISGAASAYRIERVLGEGGFGTAYLARREGDEHAVVLKVLRLERMNDWKALELFEREADVLANVTHPHIPRFFEFFAHDGQRALPVSSLHEVEHPDRLSLVLVQEYVEGRTLADASKAGLRLTHVDAEVLLRKLLGVLQYLHGLHPPVVHRDIKPSNVVLTAEGEPHVIDFGAIAQRLRPDGGSTTVGTFGYFPLEQVMGKAVPASDLYALGVTMLVTLTGTQPEELPVDPSTSKFIVHEAAPHLSPLLRRTLEAMLEPIVGQRVASAEQAIGILDGRAPAPALRSAPVLAAPPTPDRLRWLWRTALASGSGAAILLYGLLFNSFSETELVEISPLWIALVGFGLIGPRTEGSSLRRVLVTSVWTCVVLALLSVFFMQIFPAL